MKLLIPTFIAAVAFTSLHANDRDEYYNSLLAKAGATHAAKAVEKDSRDEYYASLLASMQNNNAPKSAVKSAKLAEPPADAIYNPYPNRGPAFYRYVDRDSNRRNYYYYLGRPRASAKSLAAN